MSEQNPSPSQAPKRWYDQDPLLVEVLDLLRAYPNDVREQAQAFLSKIEEQIGKDALEGFYASLNPKQKGNRWYDHDPVISRAVELLRVVSPEIQRQAAQRFLDSMKKQGLSPDLLKSSDSTAKP